MNRSRLRSACGMPAHVREWSAKRKWGERAKPACTPFAPFTPCSAPLAARSRVVRHALGSRKRPLFHPCFVRFQRLPPEIPKKIHAQPQTPPVAAERGSGQAGLERSRKGSHGFDNDLTSVFPQSFVRMFNRLGACDDFGAEATAHSRVIERSAAAPWPLPAPPSAVVILSYWSAIARLERRSGRAGGCSDCLGFENLCYARSRVAESRSPSHPPAS